MRRIVKSAWLKNTLEIDIRVVISKYIQIVILS